MPAGRSRCITATHGKAVTARNGPLIAICKQRTKHIEFFVDISSPHFDFPIP